MTRPVTVVIFAPWLGGDYFGLLLSGVAREVFGQNGRIVIVETLAEIATRNESGERGDFATAVAWSHADGVVSVTTAVNLSYLERLRDAGKPLVLLSGQHGHSLGVPLAQPDNRAGAIMAMEHLMAHGHTRIGFVGNLAQQDISDRFAAYRETLHRHGLADDSSLVFAAPETNEALGAITERAESGGAVAAASLLALKDRPTAVMAATDRNAIGLIRALAIEGVQVPRDIAVVAFDNIAASTFSNPPLTTINQRFDEVGALAGRLVLAKIQGETVTGVAFTSESAVLTVRESCGCDIEALRQASADGPVFDEASRERLLQTLVTLFTHGVHTAGDEDSPRSRETVARTMREAVRLLELGDNATVADIHALAAALQSLTSDPDTLRRFAEAISNPAHRANASAVGTPRPTPPLAPRFGEALWRLQAGAFQRETELSEAAIAEHSAVDSGLLTTGSSDPRELQWLAGTHVRLGALALWEDGPGAGPLRIAGTYGAITDASRVTGGTMTADEFPPEFLLASMTSREVCVVVPLRTKDRDWGFLSLVADIGPATMRESYQHWAALLCAALESQRLQEAVRRSALFDSLTGLPNRQLFVRALEHALALWHRSATPFAVLFLDLDGFKLINDSLGHHMGDRVLQAVGEDIQRELRSVDTAARFGGDEFVILLADTDPEGARLAALRVQDALAAVHRLDEHEIPIGASIGVATSATAYATAEDILRDADAAMYRAKEVEPGTTVVFDTHMRHGVASGTTPPSPN